MSKLKNRSAVLLVLAGIVAGCGAAAVVPMRTSSAQTAGAWGCYVADRFPDARAAAGWSPANDIKLGLDEVAKGVAAGTILAITPKGGGYASVVCVKN